MYRAEPPLVTRPTEGDFLFAPLEPFASEHVRVSDVHELYVEQCGRPDGVPVLFVHGGPGGGGNVACRRFFDPARFRAVLFDQRGCGRSRPHASLEDNTTWHLVADIEKLREHLGIERWLVFGGSWGSTLALTYAETHPERVTGLIVRGIFTLRRRELLWFYQDGASLIYPDAWESYVEPIPEEERGDMMAAYYKRLTSGDHDEQMRCARAWSIWEGSTSMLEPDADRIAKYGGDEFAIAFARIECHYFVNGGFFDCDDWILKHADRLANIPTVIVQGRYDLVCPMLSAWDLHKRLPNAELHVVGDAGHSQSEPGICKLLVESCNKYAAREGIFADVKL